MNDTTYGLKVYAGRKLVQPLTRVHATTAAQAHKVADQLQRDLTAHNVYGNATIRVAVELLPAMRRSLYAS